MNAAIFVMNTLPAHILTMLRCLRPVALAGAAAAQLLAGELKVDINRTTRNQVSQTEPGYTMWSPIIPAGTGTEATGLNAATQTFTTTAGETVTISFAQTPLSQSRGGTGILSNWFQVGAQGTAKLVSDGITVNPATLGTGGEIKMTITGLLPGTHTLLTYHNAWDNLAAGTQGPIDIYVNSVLAADNVQPTIRAATNNAATVSYVEFTVGATTDVTTILFSAELATTSARKNPVINGFELDTPNSTRQATSPSPANFDEHADADTGTITLSWAGPTIGTAVSHDVYFGTSETTVRAANRSSPEFKGNRTSLNYLAVTPDKHGKYYWRVDEIDPLGNVTKGTVWYFRPRHLAFPYAEGYGRFARGGRGGKVVKVTSLADYTSSQTPIPGTLRYAVEQETGPRTIVFDVGGLITLQSRLTLNQPYVTVAGQTAPGKGITTRQWPFGLSGARDAVVRFIRNRPGNISGATIDGGGLAGSDFSIMDHCSISWSIDEAFSSRTAKNITLQRTLISEALNIAGHQNYPPGTAHGYAATIGGDIGSFHHNLLAHNEGRNWSLGGGLDGAGFFAGRLDIRNNVVYNWGGRTTDGGTKELNFVNNYYKPGAASHIFYALTMNHENDAPGSQRAYFDGNVMPGHFDETNQTAGRRSVVSSGVTPPTYETFVAAPFFPSFVETQSARDAYKRVLSNVGANSPLDDHDRRVIGETLAGTYTYTGTGPFGGSPGLPNSQDDVGGWENYPEVHRDAGFDSDGDGLPNWWELAHGLNPQSSAGDFSDANADLDGDGYTNLDDYLQWLAVPHFIIGGEVQVDLAPLARGYTNAPQFTVTSTTGTVQLGADGHTATFFPATVGLASFAYTVTDADGSAMTGTVNFRVLDHPLVTLTNLKQSYDGAPKPVTVTTDPSGLMVHVTYNGNAAAPTLPGVYAVVATVDDLEYAGTTRATLTIGTTALVRHAPSISGQLDGSLQQLAPENVVLSGNAVISGDLIVPGTPTVQVNGGATLGGTQDAGGDAAPSDYTVTLSGNAVVRYIVRRVDPVAMPVVATPATPSGTRDVAINSRRDSVGDFATVRNLSVGGNAGDVAVPAGAYGRLTANGHAAFVFGHVGATVPDVYELQSLTLDGADLRIVGPVRIVLAGGLSLNGSATVGDASHSAWLTVTSAAGDVTLNGQGALNGSVAVPSGTITLNGNANVRGTIAADRLIINGNSLLSDKP